MTERVLEPNATETRMAFLIKTGKGGLGLGKQAPRKGKKPVSFRPFGLSE